MSQSRRRNILQDHMPRSDPGPNPGSNLKHKNTDTYTVDLLTFALCHRVYFLIFIFFLIFFRIFFSLIRGHLLSGHIHKWHQRCKPQNCADSPRSSPQCMSRASPPRLRCISFQSSCSRRRRSSTWCSFYPRGPCTLHKHCPCYRGLAKWFQHHIQRLRVI